MRIFCVVGARRSVGKTSLVEELVKQLSRKGVKVSTVKHASKSIDIPDKDTYRHLNSGAQATLAVSPTGSAIFLRENDLEMLIRRHLPKNGMILIEGFRRSKFPKIIVAAKSRDLEIEGLSGPILAVVCRSEEVREEAERMFPASFICNFQEVDKLAEKIINEAITSEIVKLGKANCKLCGYESCLEYAKAIIYGLDEPGKCALNLRVKVKIDDVNMKLKPYVESALGKMLQGFLSSLKGFNFNFENIVVEIKREKRDL